MTDLTIFVAVFIFSSFIKPGQPYISISLTESYKQYHAVHANMIRRVSRFENELNRCLLDIWK